eukprot:TRINITY_DN13257_c0_g1_i1.p1 TRINITY_DN13257_c0_g1~~TRINITY_DN13257_c0_g1_i1.p1  ORF type:complete len:155 (-),score=17.26 TRINITY_DN13257_c0_g1_i1:38-502(-)
MIRREHNITNVAGVYEADSVFNSRTDSASNSEISSLDNQGFGELENIETNILEPFQELAESVANDFSAVESEEEKFVTNTNDELDLQIEQMIEKIGGLWKCKVCGRTAKRKEVISHHTETHIEGVSHSCQICSKICTTRNSLKVHISRNHSQFK